MGTNYACVSRGSLLGMYLRCTPYEYMTRRDRRTRTGTGAYRDECGAHRKNENVNMNMDMNMNMKSLDVQDPPT